MYLMDASYDIIMCFLINLLNSCRKVVGATSNGGLFSSMYYIQTVNPLIIIIIIIIKHIYRAHLSDSVQKSYCCVHIACRGLKGLNSAHKYDAHTLYHYRKL